MLQAGLAAHAAQQSAALVVVFEYVIRFASDAVLSKMTCFRPLPLAAFAKLVLSHVALAISVAVIVCVVVVVIVVVGVFEPVSMLRLRSNKRSYLRLRGGNRASDGGLHAVSHQG